MCDVILRLCKTKTRSKSFIFRTVLRFTYRAFFFSISYLLEFAFAFRRSAEVALFFFLFFFKRNRADVSTDSDNTIEDDVRVAPSRRRNIDNQSRGSQLLNDAKLGLRIFINNQSKLKVV